ncbi:hypothetical protein [Massilia sp. erpn]|uniref:DUF6988 family protein n=1 Tax=Massilia sp. erpn TaxID=2738142 RepID=UPI0021067C96|nr:hypothetical protein [Massilia sp. erpn]UTY56054.1 hypothetical protein HPQ68_01925 [Massilia sp. erpn]
MKAQNALAELEAIIAWIDQQTAGVTLPADDRTLLVVGCLDVAIEHQAAFALLARNELHGSAFALLRVLMESLVRALWLHRCATDDDIAKFKRGKLDKQFGTLIEEFEAFIQTPEGVLSSLKKSAWTALNGFTHTGFHQVSRRHKPGRVEGSYADEEIANAIGVAGALGLVAAGELISLSDRQDRLPFFFERISEYALTKPAPA